MATKWWGWVQRNLDARDWTNADLARATRNHGDPIDESVIGRWKNKGAEPTLSSVRVVAATFGRDIREALIAAGLLTNAELKAGWAGPDSADLTTVPDDIILDEVRRRMASRSQRASPAVGTRRPRKRARQGANTRDGDNVLDAHEPEPPVEDGGREFTGRHRPSPNGNSDGDRGVSAPPGDCEDDDAPSSPASP